KKARRPLPFTIMVAGRTGKVRSFGISPRLLFWASLFLLAYLPLSVMAINRYLELRQSHEVQAKAIALLEKELEEHRRVLARSGQHMAFLQDYVRHLEEAGEQSVDTSKQEKPATKRTESSTGQKPSRAPELVNIEDLAIQTQGSRMLVSFRLVNVQPGDSSVGGYLYILARGRQSDPPKEWAYPPGKTVNGFPENYRNGQVFTIERFKPIQGRFNLGQSLESPSSVRVLIYDQSGAIILQKDFEVSS
ncbi:MAG TPA: hypothetical protein VEP29_05400, partial [Desulfatiglandales bacterium]|nr:hypothetical protein [Desulfatiglandales bacterium]